MYYFKVFLIKKIKKKYNAKHYLILYNGNQIQLFNVILL
jgi:hypothetical protein